MDNKQTFLLGGIGVVSFTVVVTMGVVVCKLAQLILGVGSTKE